MEKMFIEMRKKFDLNEIDFSVLDSLDGKTISLAATIQYLDLIQPVKEYLESKGKEVILKKGAFYEGHVLGCNPRAFDKKADTLLLLTDGKFHALNNAINLEKEILVFNTKTLEKVSQEEIDKALKKIEAKKKKFLMSNIIGLILSSKPGQRSKQISKIKKNIEKTGKKVFVFESNNIGVGELENFPEIQIWVNTACYGLGLDDSKIVNYSDMAEFLN